MKALIIEDLGYILDKINNSLEVLNIKEIDYVDNSKLAREKLKTNVYDLIITEVSIKGLSCLEITHLAKIKNLNVCIIIISNLDNSDIAQKAVKEEGAFDFVIRPSQIDKIDTLIRLYLKVRQL